MSKVPEAGDHRDLIFLELDEAIAEKYRRGRERYGPEWSGPRAMVCLADEVLDAIVYAQIEFENGDGENQAALQAIISDLAEVRREVQFLISSIDRGAWEDSPLEDQKKEGAGAEAPTPNVVICSSDLSIHSDH